MKIEKFLLGMFTFIVIGLVNFSSADFIDDISSVGSSIIDVVLYVWSFVKSLVFGVISMLTSVFELIVQLFNSGLF